MENYLMLHGQKIELTEEQIEKIRLSHGFCQTPFRVNEGETFKIGDVELRSNWKAEKQLCIACATRVLNWIDNECEKIKKEMVGDTK